MNFDIFVNTKITNFSFLSFCALYCAQLFPSLWAEVRGWIFLPTFKREKALQREQRIALNVTRITEKDLVLSR